MSAELQERLSREPMTSQNGVTARANGDDQQDCKLDVVARILPCIRSAAARRAWLCWKWHRRDPGDQQ